MMIDVASPVGRLLHRLGPFAAAVLCLGAALPAAIGAARADGRLDAKYSLTVGGVEIGRATLVAEATGTSYEIAATGRITGVLRAVSSGKGSVAARGAIGVGKVVPQVFAVAAEADGKAEGVRFAVVNNTVNFDGGRGGPSRAEGWGYGDSGDGRRGLYRQSHGVGASRRGRGGRGAGRSFHGISLGGARCRGFRAWRCQRRRPGDANRAALRH
jgi:hypothetical protein